MEWEHNAQPAIERHSPCVGICRLDTLTGLCIGCARSGEEIAQWSALDGDGRSEIWRLLPERAASLAIAARLLPLTADEIVPWVANTIEKRLGAWVTGMPGAVAEFVGARIQAVTARIDGEDVIGGTGTARFRLRRHEKLRAFAFNQSGPMVLALPKARLSRSTADVFTMLGKDDAAIEAKDRDGILFDFGLGKKAAAFVFARRMRS